MDEQPRKPDDAREIERNLDLPKKPPAPSINSVKKALSDWRCEKAAKRAGQQARKPK